MVINSADIKKTNNHLLCKLNSLNTKKTTEYDLGIPGPCLRQEYKKNLLSSNQVCKLRCSLLSYMN